MIKISVFTDGWTWHDILVNVTVPSKGASKFIANGTSHFPKLFIDDSVNLKIVSQFTQNTKLVKIQA